MKPRANSIRIVIGVLVAACAALSGAACGGGDDSGPIIVPMRDAAGNQTGSGGSSGAGGTDGSGGAGGSAGAGGSSDTGGSSGGDVDAADEGTTSMPEASTEGGACITSPVTFEDFLNACADSRVFGCLTFTTPLPSPIPDLP